MQPNGASETTARTARSVDQDTRWLCVSLHDVAPATWSHCQRVLDAVREVADIPITLLVVPAYHGECSAQPDFERAMSAQLAVGNELALHGYFHVDPHVPCDVIDWFRRRIYTAGEGEFCALSTEEARERLTLGRRWFEANNWPLAGFVAPAWLMGSGAWRAVRDADHLQYTSTLTQIITLPDARAIPAPCLTYSVRSAWRSQTSILWNSLYASAVSQSPVLRLGLHPHDADSRQVKSSWQRLLARALATRRPVTKSDFVRNWRVRAAAWLQDGFGCTGSRPMRRQGLVQLR